MTWGSYTYSIIRSSPSWPASNTGKDREKWLPQVVVVVAAFFLACKNSWTNIRPFIPRLRFFSLLSLSLSLSLSRTPGGRQDNCVHMSAVVDTHASDEIAMEENLSQWKVSGQIIRKAVTHHWRIVQLFGALRGFEKCGCSYLLLFSDNWLCAPMEKW